MRVGKLLAYEWSRALPPSTQAWVNELRLTVYCSCLNYKLNDINSGQRFWSAKLVSLCRSRGAPRSLLLLSGSHRPTKCAINRPLHDLQPNAPVKDYGWHGDTDGKFMHPRHVSGVAFEDQPKIIAQPTPEDKLAIESCPKRTPKQSQWSGRWETLSAKAKQTQKIPPPQNPFSGARLWLDELNLAELVLLPFCSWLDDFGLDSKRLLLAWLLIKSSQPAGLLFPCHSTE